MEFEGKKVVVTGGASGIGKGLCERLASLGAQVVVADLDADNAARVASAIGGTAIVCDVTNEDSVQAMVAGSIDAMGHIDVFFANAGVGFGGGLEASDEMWDLSLSVNVMGPVRAARAVVPHMLERGGGCFVVTASVAGLTTGPTSFNYATSKHAAVGVAEWIAINHGPTIQVAAICPTIVDTPMKAAFGKVLMEPLTVDDVVEATIAGLHQGSFLIMPMPAALDGFKAKANNYDGFITQMQSRIAELRAEAS